MGLNLPLESTGALARVGCIGGSLSDPGGGRSGMRVLLVMTLAPGLPLLVTGQGA